MSHAIALNITVSSTNNTASLDNRNLPKGCRTHTIDGFRVDKDTGEVYGEYLYAPLVSGLAPVEQQHGVPRPTHNPSQHLHLTTINNSNVVYVDFGATTPVQTATDAATPNTTPRRGPKPQIRLNPHAAIIKVAVAERLQWIEQAVMAGMYIAVGSNNGKLNIKPGYVRKVLTMPVISTEAIASNTPFRNHEMEPVSERYIRYLAAAGRVALGCINRHLECHPDERQRLEAKVLAPSSWGEEFDLDEDDYIEPQ